MTKTNPESDLIRRLITALETCGVPSKAIFEKMIVDAGTHQRYWVDLLVAAEDGKAPLCVFEVKIGFPRRNVYEQARRQLAGFLSTSLCFAVAEERGGKVWIAKIDERQVDDNQWVELSDATGMKRLMGDYKRQSAVVIDRLGSKVLTNTEERLTQFRNGIVEGGTIVFLILYFGEVLFHRTMSYQLAGILGLILALYAASYGVIKEIRYRDCGVTFYRQEGRNG